MPKGNAWCAPVESTSLYWGKANAYSATSGPIWPTLERTTKSITKKASVWGAVRENTRWLEVKTVAGPIDCEKTQTCTTRGTSRSKSVKTDQRYFCQGACLFDRAVASIRVK